jgi:pyruvate dehydrogenase E2 component (dihydrolipoamide acetyltransferase)
MFQFRFMEIKLPKLGEGADSGVVVGILVKPGDIVAQNQPILELENEKAIASIPSPAAGVVETIHVKNGDRVSVGQRLITLTGGAAPAAAPEPGPAARKTATQPAPVPEAAAAETVDETAELEAVSAPVAAPVASPSLRQMARELGIDLSRIHGSEAGGRIVTSDVRAYLARLVKAAAKPASPVKGAAPAAVPVDFSQWGPILKQPVTPLRKVIARHMAESWNRSPASRSLTIWISRGWANCGKNSRRNTKKKASS